MIEPCITNITPASGRTCWPLEPRWIEVLERWASARPVSGHREGLAFLRTDLTRWLSALGFEVQVHTAAGAQDVLIAVRPPSIGTTWVGMFGHYDIELPGEGWTTPPFQPTRSHERVFGRGMADNLGPLALRLLALEDADGLPGLVWVIQGEDGNDTLKWPHFEG